MKADIAQKWAAALLSGEYKQGRSGLKTFDVAADHTVTTRHCCLGVLCDIFAKETGCGGWNAGTFVISSTEKDSGIPPEEVQRWAGMRFRNPNVPLLTLTGTQTLAGLNDSGNYSFEELAEIILTQQEKL